MKKNGIFVLLVCGFLAVGDSIFEDIGNSIPKSPDDSTKGGSEAKVVVSKSQNVPLIKNGQCFGNDTKYKWSGIPENFNGMVISQPNDKHQAVSTIEIIKPGNVMMAVTERWKGGGKDGDWQKECIDKDGLLKDGWHQHPTWLLVDSTGLKFLVFTRACKKGEKFTYRTEKYIAPMVIQKDAGGGEKPEQEDRIVIWNTHNFNYRDRGAEKIKVQLFSAGVEVWGKETGIPWDPAKCMPVTLGLDDKVKSDRIRVTVTECHGRSAGLTEVQVFRNGKNIALGKQAEASTKFGRPGHGDEISPDNITDGITEDATKDGGGYWLVYEKTGWIEIDLNKKAKKK